jgi:hypothetical protein
MNNPVELYGEMELLRLLDQFFDRALCFATEGYEQYSQLQNGSEDRARAAQQATRQMRVEDSEEMTDINIKGALFGIVAALAENRDRYGTDLAGINLPFQLVRRANEPLGYGHRSAIRN